MIYCPMWSSGLILRDGSAPGDRWYGVAMKFREADDLDGETDDRCYGSFTSGD